jgi:hypothetical protein
MMENETPSTPTPVKDDTTPLPEALSTEAEAQAPLDKPPEAALPVPVKRAFREELWAGSAEPYLDHQVPHKPSR